MRATKSLSFLFLIFSFVGCTRTTMIDRSALSYDQPEGNIQELSGRLAGEMEFTDKIVFHSTNIALQSDSVSWEEEGSVTRHAATSSLKEIMFRDHTWGAIEGSVVGAVAGEIIGNKRGEKIVYGLLNIPDSLNYEIIR